MAGGQFTHLKEYLTHLVIVAIESGGEIRVVVEVEFLQIVNKRVADVDAWLKLNPLDIGFVIGSIGNRLAS